MTEDLVRTASPSLGRLLDTDPDAATVLADLDHRWPVDASSAAALARWKRLEYLRIAARDLAGIDGLERVGQALSQLAADVFEAACALARPLDGGRLTVIGMGKLGGSELNYASDVDVMFVGEGDPAALDRAARAVADIARRCFRVDLNLRPEGRDGALVRTIASYEAYWDRWAEPWEFQALLKARTVAGDGELGATFDKTAAEHLWAKPFSAEAIRSVRAMKARAEAEVARRGGAERELKRGPGGIRDVEFAVQLLQLVHGGADPELRSPSTLDALGELADAGYVDRHDAEHLADAYRFLRTVEHRLQLAEEQQIHAVPEAKAARDRLAHVLGYQGTPTAGAVDQFDDDLRRHQATGRAIHERLWFRPLLEDFGGSGAPVLSEEAAATRLAAFGFSDAAKTRDAVRELTMGLTRSSRLMQQLLPLVLDWLSATPDPDLGLLGLLHLASGPQRSMELANAFRDSPLVAQRLCVLLGTSRWIGELFRRNPDLINELANLDQLTPRTRAELIDDTRTAVLWRPGPSEQRDALKRFTDREGLRIASRDVLGELDPRAVGRALSDLAEATVVAALESVGPPLPFAVIALGRLGGGELSYASDLDLVFVYEGAGAASFTSAERVATHLLRYLGGQLPHIYDVDADLRPEGKDGPLARSIDAYRNYFERWAQPWERLAMVRARPVAGNADVGRQFMETLAPYLWERGVSTDERREIRRIKARVERERIPTDEDPEFHLKLGRGSLSDIEFCTQLLQLEHDVRTPSTSDALDGLVAGGWLDPADHRVLSDAHRFLERTRNRLFLVHGGSEDALPSKPEELAKLATSLGMTTGELRDEYRRLTRRARKVFERLFYGRP